MVAADVPKSARSHPYPAAVAAVAAASTPLDAAVDAPGMESAQIESYITYTKKLINITKFESILVWISFRNDKPEKPSDPSIHTH